mmetsp:Transcript_10306/g.35044  ORF Transcript_10306/g.35044 Transcript_10306/m.35044 type:complete len:225 (-) Transcript_10306:242-916(-)
MGRARADGPAPLSGVEPLSIDDSVAALEALFGRQAVDEAATTSAHEVRPGLFLGSIAAALDPEELHARRVTRVVNCLHEDNARFARVLPPPTDRQLARLAPYDPPGSLLYLSLDLEDTPSQPLAHVLPRAVRFVRDSLRGGERVLVHCVAGMSRSAAVVTAHLMREEGLTAARALASVQRARPCANPNSGFRRDLLHWEAQLRGERAAEGLPPLRGLGDGGALE